MVGSNYERRLKKELEKDNWLVLRSAGSHGIDLLALKPTKHILIEVKSTSKNRLKTNINQKSKEQFDMLNKLAQKGFTVFYYVWFKGTRTGWHKYQLPIEAYPTFEV